jgi:hypothetical protein
LKQLDQFILADIGSRILDAARFLFGDAQRRYCTRSVLRAFETAESQPETVGKTVICIHH